MNRFKGSKKKKGRDRSNCVGLSNTSSSMTLDANENCAITCAFER